MHTHMVGVAVIIHWHLGENRGWEATWSLKGMLTPALGTGSPASWLVSSLYRNPLSKGGATCRLWFDSGLGTQCLLAEHRLPYQGSVWQGCRAPAQPRPDSALGHARERTRSAQPQSRTVQPAGSLLPSEVSSVGYPQPSERH